MLAVARVRKGAAREREEEAVAVVVVTAVAAVVVVAAAAAAAAAAAWGEVESWEARSGAARAREGERQTKRRGWRREERERAGRWVVTLPRHEALMEKRKRKVLPSRRREIRKEEGGKAKGCPRGRAAQLAKVRWEGAKPPAETRVGGGRVIWRRLRFVAS